MWETANNVANLGDAAKLVSQHNFLKGQNIMLTQQQGNVRNAIVGNFPAMTWSNTFDLEKSRAVIQHAEAEIKEREYFFSSDVVLNERKSEFTKTGRMYGELPPTIEGTTKTIQKFSNFVSSSAKAARDSMRSFPSTNQSYLKAPAHALNARIATFDRASLYDKEEYMKKEGDVQVKVINVGNPLYPEEVKPAPLKTKELAKVSITIRPEDIQPSVKMQEDWCYIYCLPLEKAQEEISKFADNWGVFAVTHMKIGGAYFTHRDDFQTYGGITDSANANVFERDLDSGINWQPLPPSNARNTDTTYIGLWEYLNKHPDTLKASRKAKFPDESDEQRKIHLERMEEMYYEHWLLNISNFRTALLDGENYLQTVYQEEEQSLSRYGGVLTPLQEKLAEATAALDRALLPQDVTNEYYMPGWKARKNSVDQTIKAYGEVYNEILRVMKKVEDLDFCNWGTFPLCTQNSVKSS